MGAYETTHVRASGYASVGLEKDNPVTGVFFCVTVAAPPVNAMDVRNTSTVAPMMIVSFGNGVKRNCILCPTIGMMFARVSG